VRILSAKGATAEAAADDLREQMRHLKIVEVEAMTACVTPRPGGNGLEVTIVAVVVLSR